MKPQKTITLPVRNSIRRSPVRRRFLLLLGLSFVLLPAARAVTPAPDGGYAGNNTAEGDNALFSLSTGLDNTAIGAQALYLNTTGSGNTAHGSQSFYSNTTGSSNVANGWFVLFSNTNGGNSARQAPPARLRLAKISSRRWRNCRGLEMCGSSGT